MIKVHTETYIDFLSSLDKSVQDKEGYIPLTPTIQSKFGLTYALKNIANSETQLGKVYIKYINLEIFFSC